MDRTPESWAAAAMWLRDTVDTVDAAYNDPTQTDQQRITITAVSARIAASAYLAADGRLLTPDGLELTTTPA